LPAGRRVTRTPCNHDLIRTSHDATPERDFAAVYDASQASVGTWLIVIARNLLVDHFRADRGGRQQPLDDVDAEHDALAGPSQEPQLVLEPDLERTLAVLSDREREPELIALRFGGDRTGPEIAELTGLTLANVQQILSRSLRRMRAELDASRRTADQGT
jgi:RNA polymerase sigma factor (sigma-70 family)